MLLTVPKVNNLHQSQCQTTLAFRSAHQLRIILLDKNGILTVLDSKVTQLLVSYKGMLINLVDKANSLE